MSGDLHFRPSRRKAEELNVQAGAEAELFVRGKRGHQRLREAEILAAVDQVPALSSVVNQILSLAGSQHSSAADLEALVSRDMVITGRLLKMVNSPFYALSNDVRSITQAVAIVGMNSLRSLVVAASMSGLLMVDLRPYGFIAEGLWQNSIAVAALARRIVLLTRNDKDMAEDCFIAGLLRSAGMLVLSPFLVRFEVDLTVPPDGMDVGEAIIYGERLHLGFDHVWVAGRLAERWNLPQALTRLIMLKGKPLKEVEKEYRWLAAVLTLAERLANNSNIGLQPGHAFPKSIDSKLLLRSEIDSEGFRDLVSHVSDVVEASRMDLR
ncbi:MAG: HDOD domain-containing protein [Planctomycetota bacterium]